MILPLLVVSLTTASSRVRARLSCTATAAWRPLTRGEAEARLSSDTAAAAAVGQLRLLHGVGGLARGRMARLAWLCDCAVGARWFEACSVSAGLVRSL